jgi:hypothetical protein
MTESEVLAKLAKTCSTIAELRGLYAKKTGRSPKCNKIRLTNILKNAKKKSEKIIYGQKGSGMSVVATNIPTNMLKKLSAHVPIVLEKTENISPMIPYEAVARLKEKQQKVLTERQDVLLNNLTNDLASAEIRIMNLRKDVEQIKKEVKEFKGEKEEAD